MTSNKQIWDLKDILDGRSPLEAFKEAEKKVDDYVKHRSSLSDDISAEDLLRILIDKEGISVLLGKIGAYYSLKFSENTHDPEVLAAVTKFEQSANELTNKMLFFPVWFIHLPESSQQRLISSSVLKDYKYYLEQLAKERDHTKSEEIERIISIKNLTGGDSMSGLYDIFTSEFRYDVADKKGIGVEEAVSFVHSPDPSLREAAYKAVLGRYKKESTVLSEMYKTIVLEWFNEGVRIRNYPSPISIRNNRNDIDDAPVQTLLKVIKDNASVFSDYFRLKYDLLQKSGQKYPFSRYHLYAPYNSKTKEYSYDESKELVLNTYKGFSEEFYSAAKEIFDRDHVHSHPAEFKRSGAFCYSISTDLAPYILLNHTNTLRDLFTMMHEFGHGIHGMISRKQNDTNYHTALPMAETASIFGEMLLSQRLLSESSDDEEKKALLIKLLDDQYASIGRQAYFVLFEEFAHEKIRDGITKDELDRKYYSLLKEQFGDMDVPEEFSHEWNYIPHIHHTPFYCYAYSWGNLLVLALYRMFQEEGEPFKKKYSELLASGGNASPRDLLENLGIDPADEDFWQGGFDIIRDEIATLKSIVEGGDRS